jgi:hypothetical protein
VEDGRIIAAKNEVLTLAMLDRFGWLKTSQIGRLVWRSGTEDGQRRMAQKTLKRLREKHEILTKMAPDGAAIHALALGGARKLREHGLETIAHKDAMRSMVHYEHRTKANEILIQTLLSGRKGWTEHEIQRCEAPIKALRGKVPDALLDYTHKAPSLSVEAEQVLAWVEVENAYKPNKELNKVIQFFCDVLGPLDGAGFPRQYREPISPGITIGYGIITVDSKKEVNRLLAKIAAKKADEPYEYAWENIGNSLVLRDMTTQTEVTVSQFI